MIQFTKAIVNWKLIVENCFSHASLSQKNIPQWSEGHCCAFKRD